ncbi:MAG: DUF58 domain-containing protein [Planctomycetota bacterium]
MENYRQYLDPKVVDKLGRLELKARLIVEGFVQGLHRSPYHGVSVEFAEHREYVPGDDLRHLDWKVYGKSDRFYVKRYEEETNLECIVALDGSESMGYAGGERMSKYRYASMVAAALCYLVLRQRDAAGMALFDSTLARYLAPRTNTAYLGALADALDAGLGTGKTAIGAVLGSLAERIKHRGIVVVISDLFDDPEQVLSGLRRLKGAKQDVMVFHVVDPDEVSFPFDRISRFEGLEELPRLTVDPRALRRAYQEAFAGFEEKIRKGCRAAGVDYLRIETDQHLDVALSAYLANRAAELRRRR